MAETMPDPEAVRAACNAEHPEMADANVYGWYCPYSHECIEPTKWLPLPPGDEP